MAEQQRCQEGHCPCANNCGFFGSPATLNLCSKCYRDHRLKEQHQEAAAVEKPLLAALSPAAVSESAVDMAVPQLLTSTAIAEAEGVCKKLVVGAAAAMVDGSSRCAACRKRVGLTGFLCLCGATFCVCQWYAEQHGCSFDFKAAGRKAIARANPVVKADKGPGLMPKSVSRLLAHN